MFSVSSRGALIVGLLAILLLAVFPVVAYGEQPKCRGTKKPYRGKCLYPDDIEALKAKSPKGEEPGGPVKPVGEEPTPCSHYAACCYAYASALSEVQGIPAAAVDATRQGCAQVEQLKNLSGDAGQQACAQAMDAMRQAGEAYKAMPGFIWPEVCASNWREPLAATKPKAVPPPGLRACEAYEKCCLDYADALGKVEGVPASAVDATRKGCEQVRQLADLGDSGEKACAQAMDAMRQAGEAYKAMPGFDWPDSCR